MGVRIGVVGSGVVGLSTAICLARRGYDVRVFSAPAHYRLTSLVAGALWHPYAVSLPEDEERRLAAPTFRFLLDEAISEVDSAGCRMVEGVEYFDETVGADERRVPWWGRDMAEAEFRTLGEDELPNDVGPLGPLRWGFAYRLPVVEMRVFLPWLRRKAAEAGVTFVDDFTVGRFDDLELNVQSIINCSGGWATHLTEDQHLFGLRGVVVHVPAADAPRGLMFVEGGKSAAKPMYVIPHREFAVLGGTAEPVTIDGEKWAVDDARLWTPEPSTAREIVERCAIMHPPLARLVDDFDDLWKGGVIKALAGLRPRRRERGPRIELDARLDYPIIHNYGHGGAGITLCWGSALAVAEILSAFLPATSSGHRAPAR